MAIFGNGSKVSRQGQSNGVEACLSPSGQRKLCGSSEGPHTHPPSPVTARSRGTSCSRVSEDKVCICTVLASRRGAPEHSALCWWPPSARRSGNPAGRAGGRPGPAARPCGEKGGSGQVLAMPEPDWLPRSQQQGQGWGLVWPHQDSEPPYLGCSCSSPSKG